MTERLRAKHETELLATHHQSLQSHGIKGYSLGQCREDYTLAHLMGGLATPILIGGALDLSNKRGVNLIATMAARHALGHDGLRRLQEVVQR